MSEPFAWRNLLLLAEDLAWQADDETRLRTAINRAYYAAYCTAAEAVLELSPEMKRVALNHTSVWQFFRDPSDRDRWTIFDDGMNLRRARVDADYWRSMRSVRPRPVLQDSLLRSARILALLETIR